MITAVPIRNQRLSGHFSKADQFVFVNDSGQVVHSCANPALDDSCSGKAALQQLLVSQKTDRIIIRNIGERMLGKLLADNFAVYRMTGGDVDLATLASADTDKLTAVTDISQAHKSHKYEAKKASGTECGCHHSDDASDHGSSTDQACQGGRCC